jgi:cytoskeletal protein RodZ
MNRNQKIALGCGGAVGLGLIIVVIAGLVLWLAYPGRLSSNRNTTSDSNNNQNSNSRESHANTNSNASASTMSDDDKHKLFQAAAVANDQALMKKVMDKIGLSEASTDKNEAFMKDHIIWIIKNTSFISEINTKEKATAYVNAHL